MIDECECLNLALKVFYIFVELGWIGIVGDQLFDDDGFAGNAHIVCQHCRPHAALAENLLDDITAALQMSAGGQRTRGSMSSSNCRRGGSLPCKSLKCFSQTRHVARSDGRGCRR